MIIAALERQTREYDSPSLDDRAGRPHVTHDGVLLLQGFWAAENVGPHLTGCLPTPELDRCYVNTRLSLLRKPHVTVKVKLTYIGGLLRPQETC